MQWQNIPFYLFFIIRPDGNAAYSKMHENYPLTIQTDQLLGLISLFSAVNNLQTGIVYPSIISNRKEDLDLNHHNFIKSLSTSSFQIRVFDNISGYRFVLMVPPSIDPKKVDAKLQEIYKTFVNYVIKAPFFNVKQFQLRNNKRYKTKHSKRKVIKSYINEILSYHNHQVLYYNNINLKKISQQVHSQLTQSKRIPQQIIDKYLNNQSIINECFQSLLIRLSPYWHLSTAIFFHNIRNLWSTKWDFRDQNNSLYLVFWIPLTSIILTYMIVNIPQSDPSWKAFIPAIIIVLTTIMTGFSMFVYCNIMTSPHKSFITHYSISSYISIMTSIYTLSVVGFQHIIGGQFIAIGSLASIIYVLLASYVHFNVYNTQVKPTLLQMLSLVIILLTLYISTSIIFYQFYSVELRGTSQDIASKQDIQNTHTYIMLRQYLQR